MVPAAMSGRALYMQDGKTMDAYFRVETVWDFVCGYILVL